MPDKDDNDDLPPSIVGIPNGFMSEDLWRELSRQWHSITDMHLDSTPKRVPQKRDKTLLVAAGCYAEFVLWCKDQKIHVLNRHYLYVTSEEDLAGKTNVEASIIFIGTWYRDKLGIKCLEWVHQWYPNQRI